MFFPLNTYINAYTFLVIGNSMTDLAYFPGRQGFPFLLEN